MRKQQRLLGAMASRDYGRTLALTLELDQPGRCGALEILVVDTPIANLIRECKTHQIPGMMQVGKKKGNQTLDDAITDLLRAGKIAPEEAYEKSIDRKKFRALLAHPPEDWED